MANCVSKRTGSFRGVFLLLTAALSLAGCASLPNSGPTGNEIKSAATAKSTDFPYVLVEVATADSLPPQPGQSGSTILNLVRQPTDLLGPGDILNITIYEAGVTLFGGSGVRATAAGTPGFDPSSTSERLPAVRVDDGGFIKVPFVGRIRQLGEQRPSSSRSFKADCVECRRIPRSLSQYRSRSPTA